MTPRRRFSLIQLAGIAAALEGLGHDGLVNRCETALEGCPSQFPFILGTAILREAHKQLAIADGPCDAVLTP